MIYRPCFVRIFPQSKLDGFAAFHRRRSGRLFRSTLSALVLVLLPCCCAMHGQTNEWAWMGGSPLVPESCPPASGCGLPGWYGTLGMPSATDLPGARWSAASWTDSEGNLWLFGGGGFDSAANQGYLNDMWEFTPSTAEWAWMGGSNTIPACTSADGCGEPGTYGSLGTPSAKNSPGARSDAASWTDAEGNFWLFGGLGFDSGGTLGFLNDLWRFDTSTKQWTWMGGSDSVACTGCGPRGIYGTLTVPAAGNVPGGRGDSTKWSDDNGDFWIFGGLGEDENDLECYLNDLWEFNASANQWAWMGGDEQCSNPMGGYPGVYGNLGVPAAGNIPWSLWLPSSWTDSSGHLWLFGGVGEDPTSTGYTLNDMWEFYPSLNEWAWTSANSVSAPGGSAIGVYGTLGDYSVSNIPGERYAAASWTDANGNFWLLGGVGVENAELEPGWLNDLWEFDPTTNEWRWMSGSSSIPFDTFGAPGQYGTLGVPASGNTPGGRHGAAGWTDADGNLWLFGGSAFDAQGTQGTLNDLWEYTLGGTPVVAPPTPAAAPQFSLAAGTYNSAQTLAITDGTAGATIYYTTNGTVPNSGSSVYSATISVLTSETVESVAVASGHAVSPVAYAAYTINLPAAATPAFSESGGTYTSAQTVTISDATPGATIYYTTNGTTPTPSSTVYSGAITVSATETIEAIAVANGYSTSAVELATYTISVPPNFALAASPTSLTVNSGSQGTTTLAVTPQGGFNSTVSFACSGLPSGASCSFNPTTVTPSGSSVVTTQLTITVSAQAEVARPNARPFLPATALALAVCCFFWKRRRGKLGTLVLLFVFAGVGLLSGCGGGGTGGGGGGGGTGPVTSNVTVTGTSGSIQQAATIMLTVN